MYIIDTIVNSTWVKTKSIFEKQSKEAAYEHICKKKEVINKLVLEFD